jgi:hypothetical protein
VPEEGKAKSRRRNLGPILGAIVSSCDAKMRGFVLADVAHDDGESGDDNKIGERLSTNAVSSDGERCLFVNVRLLDACLCTRTLNKRSILLSELLRLRFPST